MSRLCAVLSAGMLLIGRVYAADLNMDWAYHDDNDGTDDRATEGVPGQACTFLGNGGVEIPDAEQVTLYFLTANQFAGDAEEQVFVRWWNGTEEKWLPGGWVTNVYLGSGENDAGRFHGLPMDQTVMLDVWKVDVSADITLPGVNYYAIQLKGAAEGEAAAERCLLRDAGGESQDNNVKQAWTAGSYMEHDWSVTITP